MKKTWFLPGKLDLNITKRVKWSCWPAKGSLSGNMPQPMSYSRKQSATQYFSFNLWEVCLCHFPFFKPESGFRGTSLKIEWVGIKKKTISWLNLAIMQFIPNTQICYAPQPSRLLLPSTGACFFFSVLLEKWLLAAYRFQMQCSVMVCERSHPSRCKPVSLELRHRRKTHRKQLRNNRITKKA